VDNFYTRRRVGEVGSDSALPIHSLAKRIERIREKVGGVNINFIRGDVSLPGVMYRAFTEARPDVVFHLAEQRSAPYSMIGLKQAIETMKTNVLSTLNLVYAAKDISPDVHIVKIGTMGEYGTPNIDITEGFIEIEFRGRKDTLPFPKNASSWYHWSKVHDSNNLMFANRLWNLKITDIMQGVVYGTRTEEIERTGLYTRFDIDEVWGTALNRFIAQAVLGSPITPYGSGNQKRGFLALEDSIRCLEIAMVNPPENGRYRVLNQFDQYYSINYLANTVSEVYEEVTGEPTRIEHVKNPRVESEDHYYNPEHETLYRLGYRPGSSLKDTIREMILDLKKNKGRLESLRSVIMPRTVWVESKGLVRS
ncbi:MAG: NAD-dependent epimerase/dehydratase family protein, partial [Thermoplasmatales archaeon]